MTDQKSSTYCHDNICTRVKIAVALACLRNKPSGLTGKEHSEQLCANYKLNQLKWQEKYRDAESEILHLKQQLMLQADAVSLRDDDRIQEDVGCFSQNLFPTPPASGRTSIHENMDKTSLSLSKHTAFFSHLITLKNVHGKCNKTLDDLTKASILNCLELLRRHFGKKSLSWKVQTECLESIVSLIDSAEADFLHYLAEKVCKMSKTVSEEILSASVEQVKDQESQSQLLIKLGSGNGTCQPVIESLLDFILNFSEDLRRNISTGDEDDPDYFCNMYYIITALDRCVEQKCFIAQSEDFKKLVNTRLEDCLLHITDSYPVFAHALWKICGKIP